MDNSALKKRIKDLIDNEDPSSFDALCMEIFRLQSKHNKTYRQYLDLLGKDIRLIVSPREIPLCPISFFRTHIIKTGDWQAERVFLSSGTTGALRSEHHIRDEKWYTQISAAIFDSVMGETRDADIFALLPSYLENGDSSLVCMIHHLVGRTGATDDRFYLYDHSTLSRRIKEQLDKGRRVLLFGVAFALVDMASSFPINHTGLEVIFTGGMKGRKEELDFRSLHNLIREGFPSSKITSEYGMTEMCSQAYSDEAGLFRESPTMKAMPVEITDPLTPAAEQRTARLGIIDLANVDSLSFILTDDLVRKYPGGFHILGRMDNSEMRGCNLLYLE